MSLVCGKYDGFNYLILIIIIRQLIDVPACTSNKQLRCYSERETPGTEGTELADQTFSMQGHQARVVQSPQDTS